jgi:hypothetical protein
MSCIPVLVTVVYLSAWPTFRRSGAPLHRHVYNAANVLAACLIAKAAMLAAPAMVAIPVAILTFMAVNLALVLAAIVTARQFAVLAMLKNPRTHLVVVAIQLLGAAVGIAMHWHLELGLLGLPMMFGIHAAAVRGTVADTQARVDLAWREDAWLVLAEEVLRTHRWFSILLVEPDRAADRQGAATVLHNVAGPDDSIGYYRADQLVMLLADTPAAGARMFARRLTDDLGAAGIPAAIGSADSRAGSLHEILVQASSEVVIRRAEHAAFGTG